MTRSHNNSFSGRIQRRTFLADLGFGATGLALGSLLSQEQQATASTVKSHLPDSGPHFAPRAKNVIWVFLSGGYSQMETFDPKPMLNKYAGKTFEQTPYPNPFEDPLYQERARSVVKVKREHATILPMQVGYKKRGELGIEVTDWWPHLSTCVDDISFVRSIYTTDNDHAAEFQIHHGRHKLDPKQPVIGSWIHYGLGSLNENLPEFVCLGNFKDSRTKENFDANYLGPKYGGVVLSLDPENPLPYGRRDLSMLEQEQRNQFAFVNELNQLTAAEYPEDEQVRARIKSYELAFRMQSAVPETLNLAEETAETQALYGIDNETTAIYGRRLLAARRLAERGVRFSLVYLSDYGEWDSHLKLQELHSKSCARVDKPIAGLLKDLKRRGMWEDTVVVFCTEFGRTPGVEVRDGYKAPDGRDHHPHGFTVWFAGAGIKQGHIHGATDELGFHVIENPHYVTDIHATLLHLLGLDAHRLDIPGRQRLQTDHGKPIMEILS
ncbi:MAG: DUF1501 domain-containing protein [Planctomycetaceae bacterium]|nr:DUF1501 domain-containing protein [Planctomycetaceae bacterium]